MYMHHVYTIVLQYLVSIDSDHFEAITNLLSSSVSQNCASVSPGRKMKSPVMNLWPFSRPLILIKSSLSKDKLVACTFSLIRSGLTVFGMTTSPSCSAKEMHTYPCVRVCVQIVNVLVQIRMCTHVSTQVHMALNVYACIYTCTHTCTYIYTHDIECVHMHMYVYKVTCLL